MRRLRFKSIYLKWIILFTFLIVASQGITLVFSIQYVLPDIAANYSEKLYRKAVFIQEMYGRDEGMPDDVLMLTGDTDIILTFFELDAVPEDIEHYRHLISLDMLQAAAAGDIVTSYSSDSIRIPFCLMAFDNRIALLTADFKRNEILMFVNGLQQSMIAGSIFASLMIVTALLALIRPIKKVSQATCEVAGGNFDIRLETKAVDEVGQLIHNFNVMTQALQKNEYLKKDFVSNVSHEFKTPITSIEGFALLLKNESATREEMNDYADIIIRETKRLSNLSTNLLQLSLLDSDSFEPVKTQYLLDEQIREAILLLESKWTQKQIEFDIQMDELPFCGSETLLTHVWINLIDNAIKFSPMGGVITITAERENNGITVTITDQGSGIAPEHAAKIFDRFYKADRSRSREGSGLGLSIVKHILAQTKGSIDVYSTEGKGACFKVVLPGT